MLFHTLRFPAASLALLLLYRSLARDNMEAYGEHE